MLDDHRFLVHTRRHPQDAGDVKEKIMILRLYRPGSKFELLSCSAIRTSWVKKNLQAISTRLVIPISSVADFRRLWQLIGGWPDQR